LDKSNNSSLKIEPKTLTNQRHYSLDIIINWSMEISKLKILWKKISKIMRKMDGCILNMANKIFMADIN
jgi:hypothetical protein